MRSTRQANRGTGDGGLLGRVRAGDDTAYGTLCQRHEQAVRRLARILLPSSASTGDSNGWTCQPTSAGTSCQHDALPTGGQAQGAVSLMALGSASCDQPVRLTVVSGGVRTVAQYPQTARC